MPFRITAADVTPQDILDLVRNKQKELNELEFKSQMVPERDLLKE